VQRGHTYDGLGKYYREMITESDDEPVDVVAALKRVQGRRPGVLPARRLRAGREVLRPVRDRRRRRLRQRPAGLHRRHPEWAKKFEDAGVPIVGDDIKSQVGATITHRVLAKLFEDRGVTVDRTYQLNVGGNMDFMNMLERERLESKKISKTQSVTSQLVGEMPARNVHIGPSTTSRGSTTASGRSCASRAATSVTCR
jgi:myo-inositol-1-phosphate synthase